MVIDLRGVIDQECLGLSQIECDVPNALGNQELSRAIGATPVSLTPER